MEGHLPYLHKPLTTWQLVCLIFLWVSLVTVQVTCVWLPIDLGLKILPNNHKKKNNQWSYWKHYKVVLCGFYYRCLYSGKGTTLKRTAVCTDRTSWISCLKVENQLPTAPGYYPRWASRELILLSWLLPHIPNSFIQAIVAYAVSQE